MTAPLRITIGVLAMTLPPLGYLLHEIDMLDLSDPLSIIVGFLVFGVGIGMLIASWWAVGGIAGLILVYSAYVLTQPEETNIGTSNVVGLLIAAILALLPIILGVGLGTVIGKQLDNRSTA